MSFLTRRLATAAVALVITVLVGTLGFLLIGEGAWGVGECAYMTIISATTVGYGEALAGMERIPAARAWAVLVILMGVGTFGYAASMITAFVVESDLHASFRKKAMQKQIQALTGHVIVCGVGSTGRNVVREMVATRTPCVAIDNDEARLALMLDDIAPGTVPYIVGDATEDYILEQAGVMRARGLITALPDDKDNLFVVVTARGINPGVRIISRGGDLRTAEKLRKAGAHSVVSPNFIGGMRLASEMLRPSVVTFLDEMLRDRDKNLRIEEGTIGAGSEAAGKSIRESNLHRHTDALILAIRPSAGAAFTYNPSPDTVLAAGNVLVVMGDVEAVVKLRRFLDPAAG